ncbi:MAG TPA: HIT family protein [Thermoanaerobaculia bacterium]|nr:HIT family protein [Thermoanaerobaculia bacterium]
MSRNNLAAIGPIVFEDDRCAVLLHPDRAVRGHAMVVWKRHVENVADLDSDEAAHLIAVHSRAERALLAVTGAERAVILKLGIQTPHLHLHIYPVNANLDRAAVFAIIDAAVRDECSDEEFVALAEAVRSRI